MAYTLVTNKSWNDTLSELGLTFRQWGISEWDAYTNYPRSSRKSVLSEEERRVNLRYNKNGKEVVLTMDKQKRPEDNLRVLYLAVEAMRMNEKRGISEIIASAYLQLEAPIAEKNPFEVLKIYDDTPLEVAEAVYRIRVKEAHPDTGGSNEKIQELNRAIEKIRQKYENNT